MSDERTQAERVSAAIARLGEDDRRQTVRALFDGIGCVVTIVDDVSASGVAIHYADASELWCVVTTDDMVISAMPPTDRRSMM